MKPDPGAKFSAMKIPQCDNYQIQLPAFDPNAAFMQPAQLTDIDPAGNIVYCMKKGGCYSIRRRPRMRYTRPYMYATKAAAQMLAIAVNGTIIGENIVAMRASPICWSVIFPDGSQGTAGWFLYWWLQFHGYTPIGGVYQGSPLTWTAPASAPTPAPA